MKEEKNTDATLTQLAERNLYPLLSETVRHAADHTNRNKITVGGNICGKIIYREAVLPFLLADSQVVLAGPAGIRFEPISQAFTGQLQVANGEFLVQIHTDRRYVDLPYATIKRTKIEQIDYPLVTLAALRTGGWNRVAFSGVSAVPLRSLPIEQLLNDRSVPLDERIESVIARWPLPILHDVLGSAEYRVFVLRNALQDAWMRLEGGSE